MADLADQYSRLNPERLVLVFGIVVGCVTAVGSIVELSSNPELDFHAYYVAGQAVLQGKPFVGWAITEGTFLTGKAYVYTPITAPLFSAYALFENWYVAYAVHGLILFVTFYLLGRISIQYIEDQGRDLQPIDRWLILGFCMFSGPAVIGLYRGNVDPIMLLLVVAGYLAIEQGREATGGALWAIAAAFKLFPALLGVWLLYRRAYRAIAGALCVGLGTLLVSIGVFGLEMHVEFVEFILYERSREGAFLGGLAPTHRWITLRRPLSHLFHLSGHELTLLSVTLAAPALFLLYRRADSDLDRLGVFCATVVVLLITVIPSTAGYVVYLLFPLIPLAYLVEHRGARACFLAGLLLINVPVYPQHIERILNTVSVSARTTQAVTDIAWQVLTYGSIGLWAFLLTLVGCLLYIVVPEDNRILTRMTEDDT